MARYTTQLSKHLSDMYSNEYVGEGGFSPQTFLARTGQPHSGQNVVSQKEFTIFVVQNKRNMKNYRSKIAEVRLEMLVDLISKVKENGGRVVYEDESSLSVPVVADSNFGEHICTLYAIELDGTDLKFIVYENGEEFTWPEYRVSTDNLCDIMNTIDDVIELKNNE